MRGFVLHGYINHRVVIMMRGFVLHGYSNHRVVIVMRGLLLHCYITSLFCYHTYTSFRISVLCHHEVIFARFGNIT